jgi:hypothetical protein
MREKDPLWKSTIDAILFLLSLVGILLYIFNLKIANLVLAWRVISLVLLLGQIAVNLYDRHFILSGKDRSLTRQGEWSILATDLLTVVITLPAIVVNLLFAYF